MAGRVKPERLVAQVAAAYYGRGTAGEDGRGKRQALRALIEVIDRASPGIVELGSVESGPGFDIRLAERPFPKQYEAELRRAAEDYLSREEVGEGGTLKDSLAVGARRDGLFGRTLEAIRRLFTASA